MKKDFFESFDRIEFYSINYCGGMKIFMGNINFSKTGVFGRLNNIDDAMNRANTAAKR